MTELVDEGNDGNSDPTGDDGNAGDSGNDGRLEKLETDLSGVTESVSKLVELIEGLTKDDDESAKPNNKSLKDEIDGKPVEERISSLVSTVEALTATVGGIVEERNTEKKTRELEVQSKRDSLIADIVEAQPEYKDSTDTLKGTPMKVLELMHMRATGRTDDPRAPAKKSKLLTAAEARDVAHKRSTDLSERLSRLSKYARQ